MSITATEDFAIDRPAPQRGFFSRIGERIIESRKRRADAAVASYLLSLDDNSLQRLGYDRRTIEQRAPLGTPLL